MIDWELDGVRLKLFNGELLHGHWSRNITNTDKYFRPALVYTYVARGKLGVREIPGDSVLDAGSPVMVFEDPSIRTALLGYLNSRPACYFARLLSQNLFNMTGVKHIPVPNLPRTVLEQAALAVAAATSLNKVNLTSSEYSEDSGQASIQSLLLAQLDAMKALADAELNIEQSVAEALDLSTDALRAIYSDVGFPVGFGKERVEKGINSELLRRTFERGWAAVIDEGNNESDDEDDSDAIQSPLPSTTMFEHIARTCNSSIEGTWSALRAGIEQLDWICTEEVKRIAADQFSLEVFKTFGLQDIIWGGSADRANSSGISLLSAPGEDPLLQRIREHLTKEPEAAVSEALFETVVSVRLDEWLRNNFFEHHLTQFSKRPVIWHIVSGSSRRGGSSLGLLVSFRHLGLGTLATAQSKFIRPHRQRYETEMRGIESVPQNARSDRQQERLPELMELIAELRAFDEQLEDISSSGFAADCQLRQYAVDDATLCLKARWLQRLSDTISAGPLEKWRRNAMETKLYSELQQWICDAISRLCHHCSAVGPAMPEAGTLQEDPTSVSLASLISKDPDAMAQTALKLACTDWWRPLAEAVFTPLRVQIKEGKDELRRLKEEDYSKADDPFNRRKQIDTQTKEMKEKVKCWERDLKEKTDAADKLRDEITAWKCPEAATWANWLAAQPMYDAISSLDGARQPPKSIAEWIAQESSYAPDLNDGVRVNIAPLQKAGILAAEVLAAKDVDKAIADRAEWRADERRWCREGKLPQPGWWFMEKTNVSG